MRFQAKRSGSPTVGSALLRILYSIPSLIVLAILVFVFILVKGRYPDSFWRFLLGIRWEATVFAYLASLVERYPRLRSRRIRCLLPHPQAHPFVGLL